MSYTHTFYWDLLYQTSSKASRLAGLSLLSTFRITYYINNYLNKSSAWCCWSQEPSWVTIFSLPFLSWWCYNSGGCWSIDAVTAEREAVDIQESPVLWLRGSLRLFVLGWRRVRLFSLSWWSWRRVCWTGRRVIIGGSKKQVSPRGRLAGHRRGRQCWVARCGRDVLNNSFSCETTEKTFTTFTTLC